jgi:Transposase DNA-binding
LPESMRNWADTLAAYRFLDNETVTHEQIMLPHWMTTRQEAMQHARVLLAALQMSWQEVRIQPPVNGAMLSNTEVKA